MITYSNKNVTYDDLKNITNTILVPETKYLLIALVISSIMLTIGISMLVSYKFKSDLITILVMTITLLSTIVSTYYYANHFDLQKELNNNHPKYRNLNITSHVDHISSGEKRNSQEIKFAHNNKNYYVTISSEDPISVNDKINIKIKDQIVDDRLNKYHLSTSLNKPENKITIQHRGKKYHTKMITKDL